MAEKVVRAEVPDSLRFENLNGQQRAVKTYALPVGADPETLKEEPFDYEGYRYTWAFTTKEEHPYQDSKDMVQTVTVETSKKDLSVILAELAPTIPYDDGEYAGELALDHTTIATEAAGYTTSYVITAEYKGRVTFSGIGNIIYTVVYTGIRIEPEPAEVIEPSGFPALLAGSAALLLGCILLLALSGLGIFLFLRRKTVYVYIPGDKPRDYRLIAKFRVDADAPAIDLSSVDPSQMTLEP